tara:strand:- start:1065 stop:1373 length:309 start_codon:yes stop_codon:yes gene_type:complete
MSDTPVAEEGEYPLSNIDLDMVEAILSFPSLPNNLTAEQNAEIAGRILQDMRREAQLELKSRELYRKGSLSNYQLYCYTTMCCIAMIYLIILACIDVAKKSK